MDSATNINAAVSIINDEGQSQTIAPMDSKLFDAALQGDIELLGEKAQHLHEIVTDQLKDTVLHINIKYTTESSVEFVNKVLEICPRLLKQVNEEGDTPLHVAAKFGLFHVAEVLLKRERNKLQESDSTREMLIKMKNKQGNTALDEAVRNGNIQLVKLLIREGYQDFSLSANSIHKILYLAAKSGDFEIVDAIAIPNKDLHAALRNCDFSGTQSKDTILHVHIQSSGMPSTDFVEKILDICPSLIDEVNDKNETPLHVAAKWGKSSIVEILLKHIRDGHQDPVSRKRAITEMLKMKNKDGNTTLDEAVRNGNIEVVKLFIREGDQDFSYFANNIHKILYLAAQNGDCEVLTAVDEKRDLHVALRNCDFSGMQSKDAILHVHIQSSEAPSTKFVEKILDICPSITEEVNDKNETPLHVAAKWGYSFIVEILLKHTRDGPQDPESGEKAIIKMLKMKNKDGNTALDEAVKQDKIRVVKLLIKEADNEFLDDATIGKLLNLAAKSGDHQILDEVENTCPNRMRNLPPAPSEYNIPAVMTDSGDSDSDDLDSTDSGEKSKDTFLHVHIKSFWRESTEFVEKLLDIWPSLLREVNEKGDTPLHVAAKRGKSRLAGALLQRARGSKETTVRDMIKIKNNNDNTALDEAIKHAKIEVVKILIKESADPHFSKTVLQSVALRGDHEMVDVVAQCPSGITALYTFVMNSDITGIEPKDPILHFHIKSSKEPSTKFVKTILDKCPSLLLEVNKEGDTPLHVAAKCGHSDIAEVLLKNARDEPQDGLIDDWLILRRNHEGNTALHEAVRHGKLEVVEILTNETDHYYPYYPNEAKETPLYLAAARGYDKMVVAILRSSKSAAYEGPNGMTALHAAVMNSNISGDSSRSIMKEILRKKKNLTKLVDRHGWSPLHYAAYYGLKDKASLLLEFDKSAAYIPDKSREMTALHMAAGQGHKDIIEKIIIECVDCCKLVDSRKWNVLHFAMLSLTKKELNDLLKNPLLGSLLLGDLIKKADKKGNTPLHIRAAAYRDSFHVGELQALNDEKFTVDHMIKNGSPELEEEIQFLFDDVGNEGQYSEGVIRDRRKRKDDDCFKKREERRDERRKKYYDELKDTKNTHLLVATLIATVTFTAAFTIPGGYNNENGSDPGTAILNRNSAFRIFMISDTMAMTLSLSAVFIHFIMPFQKLQREESLLTFALGLTVLAMVTVVVAFVTGLYAVLAPSSWLAIATCSLASTFFLLVLYYWRVFLELLRRFP